MKIRPIHREGLFKIISILILIIFSFQQVSYAAPIYENLSVNSVGDKTTTPSDESTQTDAAIVTFLDDRDILTPVLSSPNIPQGRHREALDVLVCAAKGSLKPNEAIKNLTDDLGEDPKNAREWVEIASAFNKASSADALIVDGVLYGLHWVGPEATLSAKDGGTITLKPYQTYIDIKTAAKCFATASRYFCEQLGIPDGYIDYYNTIDIQKRQGLTASISEYVHAHELGHQFYRMAVSQEWGADRETFANVFAKLVLDIPLTPREDGYLKGNLERLKSQVALTIRVREDGYNDVRAVVFDGVFLSRSIKYKEAEPENNLLTHMYRMTGGVDIVPVDFSAIKDFSVIEQALREGAAVAMAVSASISEARARLNDFNASEDACLEALRSVVQQRGGITPEAIDTVLGAMNHRYPKVRALAAQTLYASWDMFGDRHDVAVRIVNSKHAGDIEFTPIIKKIKEEHFTGQLPEVVTTKVASESISGVLRQVWQRQDLDLKHRPTESQFIKRTLVLLRKGLICPLDAQQRIESISGIDSQTAGEWVGRVIRASCPSLTFERMKSPVEQGLLRRLEKDHAVIRAAKTVSAEAVKQNMLTKLQRLRSSSDSTSSLAGMIASKGMEENSALLWWLRSAAASGPEAERTKARVVLERLEMSGAIGEADIAQTAQAGAKKRVLVVDDNPMDLMVARTFLERAGYEVIVAADGDKALELLREEHAQGRRVDIVVSDVQMGAPDSGYKLAKRLNEDSPSIPVILNSSEPIDEDGLSENVVATLRKLAKGADSLESKVTEVLTRDVGPDKGGMAQGAALAMTVPAKAKKVPLDSWHRRHAAAMPEFGGHDMPNRFKDNRYVLGTGEMVVAGATTTQPAVDEKSRDVLKGEAAEQMAARSYAGLWDISHMGFFEVSGENALAFLERVATRNVSKIGEGKMKYSFICKEDGTAIDEAVIYNLGDSRYLVVVNAANQEAINGHLTRQLAEQNLQDKVAITHLNDESQKENRMAALSVQGPRALGVLNSFGPQADIPLVNMEYFTVQDVTLQVGGHNIKVLMSRSGYAGEKGFEMLVPAGEAEVVWQALIDRGVMPCGLVSRDILRLEAGLGLMGHEIEGEEDEVFSPISPFETGAGFAVDFDKDVDFIGKEALLKRRAGAHREVVNLVLMAKEVPYEGRRQDSFELNMPLPRRRGKMAGRVQPASIVSVEKGGQWVEVGRITSDTVRSHTWRRPGSEEDGFKDGIGITIGCIERQFAKPGTEVRIETKRGENTYIWYAIIYPRNLIDKARGTIAQETSVPRPNLVEVVRLAHSAKDPHKNIEAVNVTHNRRADAVVQQENEIIISEEWLDGFGERRKQTLIEASKESNDIIILPLEEAKERFKAPLKPGKKQRLILLGQGGLTEDVISHTAENPECRILALENYHLLSLASAVDFGRSVLSGDDDSIREFYILLQRTEVPSPEMIERFKKDRVISLTLPEVEMGDIERIEELIEEHFEFLTRA